MEAPREQHLADVGVAHGHDIPSKHRPLVNRTDQPARRRMRGKHRNWRTLLERIHHRIHVRQRCLSHSLRQKLNREKRRGVEGEARVFASMAWEVGPLTEAPRQQGGPTAFKLGKPTAACLAGQLGRQPGLRKRRPPRRWEHPIRARCVSGSHGS